VDRRPAADARSIHAEALFEDAFVNFGDRVRNVMLQTRNVGEPQVELLGIVLRCKFNTSLGLTCISLGFLLIDELLDAAARKPWASHTLPFPF